jgi:hypothetical protein
MLRWTFTKESTRKCEHGCPAFIWGVSSAFLFYYHLDEKEWIKFDQNAEQKTSPQIYVLSPTDENDIS